MSASTDCAAVRYSEQSVVEVVTCSNLQLGSTPCNSLHPESGSIFTRFAASGSKTSNDKSQARSIIDKRSPNQPFNHSFSSHTKVVQ